MKEKISCLMADARSILEELGCPTGITCRRCLIAFAGMMEHDEWKNASAEWRSPHDVIEYLRVWQIYNYAENSRESIRKGFVHVMLGKGLLERNEASATNSGSVKYRLTKEAVDLIRTYGTSEWETALKYYRKYSGAVEKSYVASAELNKTSIQINGEDFKLSPGEHNLLQKAVVEVFLRRFASDARCLYVGDSSDRYMYKDDKTLGSLGFDVTQAILPDVILFDEKKKWLYFIECVTSVGPVSEKRKKDFEKLTTGVDAGNVYITAFPDFATFKKFSSDLAWETEVWIAEVPEHMIHLNGDRFIGPRRE